MKRIFVKKEEEKKEKKERGKVRFLNKKVLIAIMLMLILILISMLIVARSNGIKNFGDVKNLISDRLNKEEPKAAATITYHDYKELTTLNSKYSYATIFWNSNSHMGLYNGSGYNKNGDVIIKQKVNNDKGVNGDELDVLANEDGKVGIVLYNTCIDADGDLCDVLVEVTGTKRFTGNNGEGFFFTKMNKRKKSCEPEDICRKFNWSRKL